MTQAHAGVRTSPEAARNRLIVALDVPRVTEAIAIAEELGDIVSFYKIGPHLLLDPELHSLFRRLKSGGKNVFLDCKLFDIPATVAGAVRAAANLGVKFITVAGQQPIIRAAVKAKHGSSLQILVVTLLTYMDQNDLQREYQNNVSLEDFILARAKFAAENGCDGVISSAREVRLIRESINQENFMIVTPGIRPRGSELNDQKRVVTPYEAIANGSDYLVIGRPIIDAPSRRRAAEEILSQIRMAIEETVASGPRTYA